MQRALIGVALLLALLTGCDKSEVTVSLRPNFYPSAVAYDSQQERYLVGSFLDGQVVVLDKTGKKIGAVRPATPGERVLRLAIDQRKRRLWVGLAESVESIDLDRPSLPRHAVKMPPMRVADLTVAESGFVYLLDAESRAIFVIDSGDAGAKRIARLPPIGAPGGTPAYCSLSGGIDRTYIERGAMMLSPDERTLFVAVDNRLFGVDVHSGQSSEVILRAPLTYVTQLVYRPTHAGGHEMMAIRGEASRITHLRFDSSMREVLSQESFRAASAGPLAVTLDGSVLRMIVGTLRHHPVYCGDGRPNTPIRLVEYPMPAAPHAWSVANQNGRVRLSIK